MPNLRHVILFRLTFKNAMTEHKTQATMESSVERIVGRALTRDELQMLIRLRDDWGYTNDDPLVVVLALTGGLTLIANDIPARIQAASDKIIETHATVLRSQSNLIAKEMVGTIAELVHNSGRTRIRRIGEAVACAVGGAVVSIGVFWIWFIKH